MNTNYLEKKFKNKKSGKIYTVIGEVLNCTNVQDGQQMFLYIVDDIECDLLFVREKEEFLQKFEPLQ